MSARLSFPKQKTVSLLVAYRKDALRSIIISQQLLGTREVALFHHTDCGMLTFTDADLKSTLKQKYPSSEDEINKFDFYPFPKLEQSVKDDIAYLKSHPLILKEIKITGWVYDVETGKVSFNWLGWICRLHLFIGSCFAGSANCLILNF